MDGPWGKGPIEGGTALLLGFLDAARTIAVDLGPDLGRWSTHDSAHPSRRQNLCGWS
jgi:hypothetical protein